LFGCDHAYVQPHSGADANLVAFWAVLRARVEIPAVLAKRGRKSTDKPTLDDWRLLSPADWNEVRRLLGSQRILAMDLYSGGHLTHGYRLNVSARMFEAHHYRVSPATGLLDYDAIEEQARAVRPLILLAGYSAYPRNLDCARLREIADRVGAVFMVDMAHFAGLVAGGVMQGQFNPVAHAQVVTSTTHKTLRGPRGGLVLCTREFQEHVDKGCPMVLGGPLPHVLAAKAVCFTEALRPEFKEYAARIVANARTLAAACQKAGINVVSGTTENHLVLLDVRPRITGRQAEAALRQCHVTLNRNTIPDDSETPLVTSGLRLGTAALTTLGMNAPEMEEVASIIGLVLSHTTAGATKTGEKSKLKFDIAPAAQEKAVARVKGLLAHFPLYPEIDLPYLEKNFSRPPEGVRD
jgi:glycine hydroxymethyltransferase